MWVILMLKEEKEASNYEDKNKSILFTLVSVGFYRKRD